jgi:CxxC motif-containing protein
MGEKKAKHNEEAQQPQKMICIGCPLGCHLAVEYHGEDAWEVTGYDCKKGKNYGHQEVTDPRRMVTTTVAVTGALWARLPVRSEKEVPKGLVVDVCREIHKLEVTAPVRVGDIILDDVLGTGIAMIATRSLEASP